MKHSLVDRLRQEYLVIGDHWSLHQEAANALEMQAKTLHDIKQIALASSGEMKRIISLCDAKGISEKHS